VSTEVVHHHDVAWLKGRDQMAGYPAKKDLAVHGTARAQATQSADHARATLASYVTGQTLHVNGGWWG
jgi:NAD(P)-dependent dehydrogenase (short-subunit alcohol dehydrogenase family)